MYDIIQQGLDGLVSVEECSQKLDSILMALRCSVRDAYNRAHYAKELNKQLCEETEYSVMMKESKEWEANHLKTIIADISKEDFNFSAPDLISEEDYQAVHGNASSDDYMENRFKYEKMARTMARNEVVAKENLRKQTISALQDEVRSAEKLEEEFCRLYAGMGQLTAQVDHCSIDLARRK